MRLIAKAIRISHDLQLYKIFKITRVSFLGHIVGLGIELQYYLCLLCSLHILQSEWLRKITARRKTELRDSGRPSGALTMARWPLASPTINEWLLRRRLTVVHAVMLTLSTRRLLSVAHANSTPRLNRWNHDSTMLNSAGVQSLAICSTTPRRDTTTYDYCATASTLTPSSARLPVPPTDIYINA